MNDIAATSAIADIPDMNDNELIDEDSIDPEALQAQIDLSMSFAEDMISSWVDPTVFPKTSRHEKLEKELAAYLKQPPRLGVGASVPEGYQADKSMAREAARIKGKLAGTKRTFEDRQEDSTAASTSKQPRGAGDDSDEEHESRSRAIKKKEKFDPFDVVHGKKKKKQKHAGAQANGAVAEPGTTKISKPDSSAKPGSRTTTNGSSKPALNSTSKLKPETKPDSDDGDDDSEVNQLLLPLPFPNGDDSAPPSPVKKKRKNKHKNKNKNEDDDGENGGLDVVWNGIPDVDGVGEDTTTTTKEPKPLAPQPSTTTTSSTLTPPPPPPLTNSSSSQPPPTNSSKLSLTNTVPPTSHSTQKPKPPTHLIDRPLLNLTGPPPPFFSDHDSDDGSASDCKGGGGGSDAEPQRHGKGEGERVGDAPDSPTTSPKKKRRRRRNRNKKKHHGAAQGVGGGDLVGGGGGEVVGGVKILIT